VQEWYRVQVGKTLVVDPVVTVRGDQNAAWYGCSPYYCGSWEAPWYNVLGDLGPKGYGACGSRGLIVFLGGGINFQGGGSCGAPYTAQSGGVAMFHAVGRTPEAPTLEQALGGHPADRAIAVDTEMLAAARAELSTRTDGPLAAISVGTPHFSVAEFRTLAGLVAGRTIDPEVEFYVNTSREVLAEAAAEGLVTPLRTAGIEIVTDTCTYITPIMRNRSGVVMTNSGKMAYYAPGNLGVDVAFGSLAECVESGVTGRIAIDSGAWR